MSDVSAADRAREAARNCEGAGLLAEADILYRLAVSLELEERASASASLARVLISAGALEEARPFAVDGDDPVLMAVLAFEAHDFGKARRLLDEARARDPFDPRSASARGRLAFLEKRFAEAIGDLLEAALLRAEGIPEATDARFLRAGRALAPAETPAWKEAVAAAHKRLESEARRRSPDLVFPDRTARLVRSLIFRGGDAHGLLDRASRLAGMTAIAGMGDHALLAAAGAGDLRRIAAGSTLYRAGDPAEEVYFVVGGNLELVRETPVGAQPFAGADPGDFAGEEALIGETRSADARAAGAVTLLGFTPEFLFENSDRASWLRHLRACLARRLSRLNGLFEQFFPGQKAPTEKERHSRGEAAAALSAEEKSRSLTSGGLSESDRFLFAAFAEERSYAAE